MGRGGEDGSSCCVVFTLLYVILFSWTLVLCKLARCSSRSISGGRVLAH